MRLTVIGCSPAFSNPGQPHAGLLVEGPGRLLLDCGPGVLAALRAHDGGGWPRLDAIVLSHLHIDHWADVVAWLWGAVAGPGRGLPQPQLWVCEEQRAQLLELADALADAEKLQQVLGVHGFPAGEPFALAGFELLALPVAHYRKPTWGLRVSDGRAVLAYSADTGPCPALAELARDADLLVCEATLADGEDEGELRGHLSAAEAQHAAAAAGARRLLLTHRPLELPVPAGAELARPGLCIDL